MNISNRGFEWDDDQLLTELTSKNNIRQPIEFSVQSLSNNVRSTNIIEGGESNSNYAPSTNLLEKATVINSNLWKKKKSLLSVSGKGTTKIRSAAPPISLEMWQTLTCLPKSCDIITQLPSNEEKDGNCYGETSNANMDTNMTVSEFQLCKCEDRDAYNIVVTKKKKKSVRFAHAYDCAYKN